MNLQTPVYGTRLLESLRVAGIDLTSEQRDALRVDLEQQRDEEIAALPSQQEAKDYEMDREDARTEHYSARDHAMNDRCNPPSWADPGEWLAGC